MMCSTFGVQFSGWLRTRRAGDLIRARYWSSESVVSRQDYPLKDLLSLAHLSRSTFYYHIKSRESVDKYVATKEEMSKIHKEHSGRYGYRRMTAELRRRGVVINHKTVNRISDSPRFSCVMDMLETAIEKLPDIHSLILHSDQGWQYRMRIYCGRLRQAGITQSMSRKGNCLDNAVMEGFFGHLKRN